MSPRSIQSSATVAHAPSPICDAPSPVCDAPSPDCDPPSHDCGSPDPVCNAPVMQQCSHTGQHNSTAACQHRDNHFVDPSASQLHELSPPSSAASSVSNSQPGTPECVRKAYDTAAGKGTARGMLNVPFKAAHLQKLADAAVFCKEVLHAAKLWCMMAICFMKCLLSFTCIHLAYVKGRARVMLLVCRRKSTLIVLYGIVIFAILYCPGGMLATFVRM